MARTVPFTTTAIIPIVTACIRDTAEAIIQCIRRDTGSITTKDMAAMVAVPRIPGSIKAQRNSSGIS